MQQREDTIEGIAWYSSRTNENGPITAIDALENSIDDWDYVNNLNYTMGTTVFGTGEYATSNVTFDLGNGDKANSTTAKDNRYTWEPRIAKARMITAQEASEMGCEYNVANACKKFMFNGLDVYNAYWTMSTKNTKNDSHTYTIDGAEGPSFNAALSTLTVYSGESFNARAVVEISK